MPWSKDIFVKSQRAKAENDQSTYGERYNDAAHQRLDSVKQGGSASPLFSPWLALKQALADQQMRMAERDLPGTPAGALATPQSIQRDKAWEQQVKEAQAEAALRSEPNRLP